MPAIARPAHQVGRPSSDRRLGPILLFLKMDDPRAWGRTGAAVATDIARLVPERPQPRLHERPGAHVHGFFLHPNVLLCSGIATQQVSEMLFGKRVKLLDSNNRDSRIPVADRD